MEQTTVSELRAQLEELERERDWTRQQHRRWGEEREALVEELHRFRSATEQLTAHNEELARELAQLHSQHASLQTAHAWFVEQHKAWENERLLLLDAVDRMSVAGRLRAIKNWLRRRKLY